MSKCERAAIQADRLNAAILMFSYQAIPLMSRCFLGRTMNYSASRHFPSDQNRCGIQVHPPHSHLQLFAGLCRNREEFLHRSLFLIVTYTLMASCVRYLYWYYRKITRHPLFWVTQLAGNVYLARRNIQAQFEQLVHEHRERKQWMEPQVPDDEFLPDNTSSAESFEVRGQP